jgi:hypothetical protein
MTEKLTKEEVRIRLDIARTCTNKCPICGVSRSNPRHTGKKCSAIMKARQQAKS